MTGRTLSPVIKMAMMTLGKQGDTLHTGLNERLRKCIRIKGLANTGNLRGRVKVEMHVSH